MLTRTRMLARMQACPAAVVAYLELGDCLVQVLCILQQQALKVLPWYREVAAMLLRKVQATRDVVDGCRTALQALHRQVVQRNVPVSTLMMHAPTARHDPCDVSCM